MNSPTEKIISLLQYAGNGGGVLQLSGQDFFNLVEWEVVGELIDQGVIVQIKFGEVDIKFHYLLIIILKAERYNRNEFTQRLIFGLLKRNIVELSKLVFGDDPLPERLFPLGHGIYELEKGVYLNCQSSTKTFSRLDVTDGTIAQGRFQIINEANTDRILCEKKLSIPKKWGYENDFPKFSIETFYNYLENWVRGKRFHFEGGRFVNSPLFLQDE